MPEQQEASAEQDQNESETRSPREPRQAAPGTATTSDRRGNVKARFVQILNKLWLRATIATLIYVAAAVGLAIAFQDPLFADHNTSGAAFRDAFLVLGLPAALMVGFWRGLSTDDQTEAANKSAAAAKDNAAAAKDNVAAAKKNFEVAEQHLEITRAESTRAQQQRELYDKEVAAVEGSFNTSKESNVIARQQLRFTERDASRRFELYEKEVQALEHAAEQAKRQADASDQHLESSKEESAAVVAAAASQLEATQRLAEVLEKQVESTNERTRTEEKRVVDEQFYRALELLRNPEMSMRLDGIQMLARIRSGLPDDYHDLVIDVLCTFVRYPLHHASNGLGSSSREDVRAAVLVIAAKSPSSSTEQRARDLCGADLRGLDLGRGEIELDLSGVRLRHADLSECELTNLDMMGADLTGASLVAAEIRNSNLQQAILEGANLTGALLDNVNFGTRDDETRPSIAGIQVRGVTCSGNTDASLFGDRVCQECGSGMLNGQS